MTDTEINNILFKKDSYKLTPLLTVILIIVSTLGAFDAALNVKGTGLIAMTVGGAVLAAVLHFKKKILFGLIPTAAAYIAAAAVLGSAVYAIPALTVFPIGFTLNLVTEKRISRLNAFIISSVIVFAVVFGSAVYSVYDAYGAVTAGTVKEFFSPVTDAFKKALSESFVAEIAGSEVSLLDAEMFDRYIDLLIILSPALSFAFLSLFPMMSSWLYRAILGISSGEKVSLIREWKLEPSPISGAVFCASFILSLIIQDGSVAGYAALYIALITGPIMFFSGIGNLTVVKIVDGVPHVVLSRFVVFTLALFISIVAAVFIGIFFGTLDSIKRFFPGNGGFDAGGKE